MQVCDGNNDNLNVCRLVDEAIWKSLHLATANRAAQRMPCMWKFFDASDGLPCFISKLISQWDALGVVVLSGFDEFAPRR